MQPLDVRSVRGKAPGDRYSDEIDAGTAGVPALSKVHPLDSEESRELHRKLLNWFYLEREKQAQNRMEIAMDHDFYDGIQWDEEDAAILRERGQMPLVYNEVAPMVDWLIGTERRTRVDWNVFPRTEDDVQLADTKKKVLKYISDINRVVFNRSRAFADCVKGGVGWLDDGVRDDPTQDILYSKYEDWRNVLWDSSSYELDLSDARYVFRWRWVDEDIALMMFPDRADKIRKAIEEESAFSDSAGDEWFYNERLDASTGRSGRIYSSGTGVTVDAVRRRVRLIECQYRMPTQQKMVASGSMKGAFFNPTDQAMADVLARENALIVDRVMMRVHFAVFTEADMLSEAVSALRHNRFGLTPIWCYRRSRDRLPYGAIRRVRDIQQDLNKRASKALFMLNTNQIIMDDGAVEDPNQTRDEVDRPDGNIVKKKGHEFIIRRDTDAATGQIQMMTLAAQSIQKTAGVNNENLGRQTNAVSGAAITARQQQGAVGTTEPFDNLRLAVQIQGEKQLSLAEQFYTEEKVIRLTEAKNKIDWVRINQPEVQADGSVRWLNDITATQADFVVSEQDYAGTLRQVMFDSLIAMAGRLDPNVALRMLRIAFEFSDMPNKEEIASAIRQVSGEPDPNQEMTPEEMRQQEDQMRAQLEAIEIQRQTALTALEEQRARVREINARAMKAEAEAGGTGEQTGIPAEVEAMLRQVQSQAADQIDALTEQLRKVQADAANKTMAINKDADVKVETARIEAASRERVAEIQAASNKALESLERRMESMLSGLEKKIEQKTVADPEPKPEKEPAPAEPAIPPTPIIQHLYFETKQGIVKKTLTVEKDANGDIVGGTVTETDESEGK